MKRPSPKEINKKLNEAKTALESYAFEFANVNKAVGELMILNIGNSIEVAKLIRKQLDEIRIEDYVGTKPPQINYEPKGNGLELWAFCWNSKLLKQKMYLKFAINNGLFYYVSLHKSKLPKKLRIPDEVSTMQKH